MSISEEKCIVRNNIILLASMWEMDVDVLVKSTFGQD